MTEPSILLKVNQLTVALPAGMDRENAIEDVDLEVRQGQIVCLVGESGSGKSVTAASVMGVLPRKLLTISRGSILLEGEEIAVASDRRLCELRGSRMAMVFQEPLTALNPVMTIGAQIAEVIKIHEPNSRKRAIDDRVLELLTDVHLPDPAGIRHSYPHQLSGGQRQRAVIAMALALEPALIIADEPTTALDVTTQAQILKLFRELLFKHKSALLLITHDFGVVAEVADEILVMRHGRVVERGGPRDVLDNPSHPYTQALVAAVPSFRFRRSVEGTTEPVLKADNLHLTYQSRSLSGRKRETRALNGVSFEIGRGETVGIVGESGSGKTTLAKCVMRFEVPDRGRISINGHNIELLSGAGLRNFRRRIQMIFQDPYKSLNPRRTVGQAITEGPIYYGTKYKEAVDQAGGLLELVGLRRHDLDRFPHEFSGGQRQRICIARALAMEPEIIVADEPVSALDVSVQAQVLDLFESLRKKLNFSMLFITHDLRVASNICDRVAVMSRGRIVEIGETETVFRNPQDDYTVSLLAAVPGGLELTVQAARTDNKFAAERR
ncbi:dipeptide ABC transporter ATP-binding protein [Bradyrhizobium sp. CCBAU 51627]|uniref:dipeptide ABC transporter ATP-binding protein n=1 Tax=Bradyrhizobium sp. CCBAU 51627 TaxID=1325088 RepID=UPI002304DCAF|nr:ABC transporter ATP-binding protein [Bradyrhizobium sp. CCBAU 51627]MDA9433569.1 microcin ABC transporter ATP-binding protein [Bradyrhizobium sp. CCBAU 51627]